jgi:hypothetical protein
MQHMEGSGRPVLYIGRTILKGQYGVEKKTRYNAVAGYAI